VSLADLLARPRDHALSTPVLVIVAERRATVVGTLVVVFLMVAGYEAVTLAQSVKLDALATPTQLCIQEIEAVVAVFLVSVAVMQPVRDAFERSGSPVAKLFRVRIKVPVWGRALGLVIFAVGFFGFSFWSVADVLGGYNGYNVAFKTHPFLAAIYSHSIGLMPILSGQDKGTQASTYLTISVAGLVVALLNRGLGSTFKEVVTLFAAPVLVVFELALWPAAPEDMTWHVTDYLWWGGVNDGGYRARDFLVDPFTGGGPYIISNWLVLAVCFILVAYRLPLLSVPSRMLWARVRGRGSAEAERRFGPAGRTTPRPFGALLSRRHSGFCGLNRLDESAKADHYSRKLCQAELPRGPGHDDFATDITSSRRMRLSRRTVSGWTLETLKKCISNVGVGQTWIPST